MKNIDLLKSIGIFAQVPEEDLEKIEGMLKEKRVGKDTTLFRQGEPGDGLYIVQGGRIKSVGTDAVGRERVLGFYGEGQFFGEMALLAGEAWPATMQAAADTLLLVLGKEDFDACLAQNIQLYLQMVKVIADRQAHATPRVARVEDGIATTGSAGGKVFTVFSPKGGVGKSMLATNLAVTLARRYPESVALMDFSLTFGHDLLLLNMAAKSSLASTTADALRKMGMAEGLAYYLAVHESTSLRVLAGSARPEEGESVTGDAARVAIDQLKKYFAYIVIDTSSTFSDPVLAALEASDRVLMVCSPEIAVLRDIRECQRIFNDVVHLPKEKVLYLMNNVFPHKGLSKGQFEDALQQPLYMELPNGGDGPLKASLRGEAFVESQSGSSISKAVQKLGAQLVADTASRTGFAAQQEKKKGLFGW